MNNFTSSQSLVDAVASHAGAANVPFALALEAIGKPVRGWAIQNERGHHVIIADYAGVFDRVRRIELDASAIPQNALLLVSDRERQFVISASTGEIAAYRETPGTGRMRVREWAER
jgi:hypothetical protein